LGIKEFFIHFDNRTGLEYILADKSIAVIYLSRSNLIRRYLSMVHMQKTKVVLDRGASATRGKFHIDISDMLRTLAILKDEVASEQAWISQIANSGHKIFEVKYEEYFLSEATIASTNKRLFQFLGVEPIPATSTHRKILSNCFVELIENSDEFFGALKNTEFADYLNQD
jgi:LPS sulfotransferase NodH